MKQSDEFFVGYLPNISNGVLCVTRKFAVASIIGVSVLAIIVAVVQKRYTTNAFDYGEKMVLKGHLHFKPVPYLEVILGTDVFGNVLSESILLVSEGKHGANSSLNQIKLPANILEGTLITVEGYFIYGDGKALFQMKQNLAVNPHAGIRSQRISVLHSNMQLSGEVIDPKCYFGVMNPGEGKPHRSCAIRCISGGIPAVLKSQNSYFLLVDTRLVPLKAEILDVVGENIQVTGEVSLIDQWKVLKVDKKEIDALASRSKFQYQFRFMQEGIPLCSENSRK